ncbi:uncharacterized protein F4817DRAFT_123788 [Daldinia loculata]|uniref:uncharacterized protein n=1 Tax=Daldinia loculata TaxID=103429 RepID=UPI0020C35CB9|nr:uncharacterized protein F4817DRAFT_123788 [Daldinia loculata]KAI1646785.1 hypothetical protein F4817DRAFT_123788 [Daldinia loculata]
MPRQVKMSGPDGSRRPSASSTGMPFIISSSIEKTDPATRKLIRSHARRGKTRKGVRPAVDQRSASRTTTIIRAQSEPLKLEEVVEVYAPLIPGRIGLNLYFVNFSDDVEPLTLFNMAKVTTVSRKLTFPLRAAISFEGDDEGWVSPFGRDAVALHIMAFAVQGFIDRVLRRQGNLNPVAILHFQKGLRLLRERLLGDDDQTKISDSTMSVVLKLASVAQFDGDYETSKQHMEGLRKMVDLRGGLDVFEGTPLLLEMLRCDLGVALLNGSCPVFFIQPSEPMAEYPEKLMPASVDGALSRGDMKQVGITEDELVTAWRVLKRFCLFIDLGTQTRQTVRSDIIYETMTAVTYRLLHMRFSSGSADEAVRQGLSAFCYHVFLQWQDIKPPYCDLAVAYQISIFSLVPSDAVSSQLILWLLIIGAISIFNISDEVWLRERIEEHVGRCHIKTWREMQDILKSFMWIAVLDEQSGRRIYDFLFK